MKIGLNFLRIQPGYKGGISTFTFGLLEGFAASRRGHEFVIFAAPHNYEIFSRYAEIPNFRVIQIWESKERLGHALFYSLPWWIRYRIPLLAFNALLNADHAQRMASEADVIYVPYGPSPLFPFPDRPTVYSIHDLQDIHYPQFFTAEQRFERLATYRSCALHASLIQASSEQMRDDFLENLSGLAPDKVAVIQEGVDVDNYVRPPSDSDVRIRYGLPPAFLYFPAQLWHHKNHITVLKALARLKRRGIHRPLVMSGAKYPGSDHLFDFIAQNGLGDQVFYLGLIPSEDVLALYHAAKFLITAVLYESSSLPILEAAASGTPIIASRTQANEERARDLQLNLFTPTDDAELADLLEKIWDDGDLVSRQVEHNNNAIRKFNWNSIAENYLDMFEALPQSGK